MKNFFSLEKKPLIASAIGAGILLLNLGCRQEMYNDAKYRPLEKSDFFDDKMVSRSLVPHTVARDPWRDDDAFNTGKTNDVYVKTLPMPLNEELLHLGQKNFNIYCSVCHGLNGKGNGMIVQRGFPAPSSLHDARLKEAPIGYFFDVMTKGYGVMYSYASRVTPQERWAVAAYIRALQLSHSATLQQVPLAKRTELEAQK